MGHLLIENHHGLVVNTKTTLATGITEREAVLVMVKGKTGISLGGDRGYDAWQFPKTSKLRKLPALWSGKKTARLG